MDKGDRSFVVKEVAAIVRDALVSVPRDTSVWTYQRSITNPRLAEILRKHLLPSANQNQYCIDLEQDKGGYIIIINKDLKAAAETVFAARYLINTLIAPAWDEGGDMREALRSASDVHQHLIEQIPNVIAKAAVNHWFGPNC